MLCSFLLLICLISFVPGPGVGTKDGQPVNPEAAGLAEEPVDDSPETSPSGAAPLLPLAVLGYVVFAMLAGRNVAEEALVVAQDLHSAR